MPILDDRDMETEGLITEYQRNAKPTQSTIPLYDCWDSMEEEIGEKMKEQE